MLNRSRTAMALLLAASVFALPTGVLAAQSPDEDKAADKPASNTSNSSQRNASAPNAANRARISTGPEFYIAGPSRFVTSSSRNAAAGSPSRQQSFTEAELRQIRAAQQALLRQANPLAGPSRQAPTSETGGVLLSHPTLGRIVIGGATGGGEQDPAGLISTLIRQNPGLLMGPSPVSSPSGIKHDMGATSESGSGGSSSGSGGGAGSGGGGGGLPGDFPILEPGRGFSGPTAQPPAVGNPHLRGYDAEAIARWDVVPYQDFTGLFHIGVVAFHMNGIDRVEFSVNGGRWTPVTEMKLNPRTNVWEYTATLDASLFDDGLIEVRARVFPKNAGEVRVLAGEIDGHNGGSVHFRNGMHSMFLNANAGGTLPRHEVYADAANGNDSTGNGTRANPFRSASRALAYVTAQHGSSDGAICYLLPGEYVWEGLPHPHRVSTGTRWATVTAAPGVNRELVRFVDRQPAGMRTRLLRADNISMTGNGTPRTFTGMDTYFWVSNSVIAGPSRFEGGGLASGSNDWAGIFGTDLIVSEVRSPFRSSTFVRNVQASGFSDTPFGADTMVLNADVRDFSRHPDGTHADVFHWFWRNSQDRENRIVYGLRVYEFPLLGFLMNPIRGGQQGIKDVAIVNVHISKDDASVASSMWNIDTEHLVISGLQLPDQTFRFDVHRQDEDGALTLKNVSVTNSVFAKLTGRSFPEDAIFRNIHIIDGNSHMAVVPLGDNVTAGHLHGGDTRDQIFANPRGMNYQPRPSSVIWGRIPARELLTPADVLGRPARGELVPLGAYFGDAAAGG